MPNRILRDWTASDKINGLTVHAERFFTRLIMKADDYGCFNADTRLLKANLFPLLLDGVRDADISRWMAECQKAGLIVIYEANSKKYLQIIDFRQRLDKARSKFPLPESDNGEHRIVNEFPAETEVETETEYEPEVEKEKQPFLVLPFNSESFVQVWNVLVKEKKWKKKSAGALQASLELLSKHSEEDAIQMMKNTIAGEWQGLFEIKKQINGNHNDGKVRDKNGHTIIAGKVTEEATSKLLAAARLHHAGKENAHGNTG